MSVGSRLSRLETQLQIKTQPGATVEEVWWFAEFIEGIYSHPNPPAQDDIQIRAENMAANPNFPARGKVTVSPEVKSFLIEEIQRGV